MYFISYWDLHVKFAQLHVIEIRRLLNFADYRHLHTTDTCTTIDTSALVKLPYTRTHYRRMETIEVCTRLTLAHCNDLHTFAYG